MTNDFDNVDNTVIAEFIDGISPVKEQMLVTNSVKTYRDLWVLSNMCCSKEIKKEP